MNENQMAESICALEGGKVNLTIAQVKEVLNCQKKVLESLGYVARLKYFLKITSK